MIDFINKTDVFILLKIDNLEVEEKKELEERMINLILASALDRMDNDQGLDEAAKTRFNLLLNNPSDDPIIDQQLMQEYPQYNTYIMEEGYIYKKNALLDLINSNPEFTQLRTLLESNSDPENKFEELWKEFINTIKS